MQQIAQSHGVSILQDPVDSNESDSNRLIRMEVLRGIYHERTGVKEQVYGNAYQLLNKIRRNVQRNGSTKPLQPVESWCTECSQDKYMTKESRVAFPCTQLPASILKKLRCVPKVANTVLEAHVRNLIDNKVALEEEVEVVEITDLQNPARLFSIPGETVHGVIAKRDFMEGSPLLCYGGVLKEPHVNDSATGAYAFDIDLPDEYNGPELVLDGNANDCVSLGGRINDSWSPAGLPGRNANVKAVTHWDSATDMPQVVFYAMRCIKKGEEILYHYGENYWKVMWKNLIVHHAGFAEEQLKSCDALRKRICEETRMDEEEVNMEIKKIYDNETAPNSSTSQIQCKGQRSENMRKRSCKHPIMDEEDVNEKAKATSSEKEGEARGSTCSKKPRKDTSSDTFRNFFGEATGMDGAATDETAQAGRDNENESHDREATSENKSLFSSAGSCVVQ